MANIQLYEVSKELDALLNQADPETGELPENIIEQIDALTIERDTLINQAGLIYKMAELDADKVDEEIKRLQSIKKFYTRKSEVMERLLNKTIRLGEEFKFSNLIIKWRKNPPKVETTDLLDLNELQDTNPELIKIEYSLDKAKVKELAKNNIPLPAGIKVIQEHKLTIK